MGVYSLWLNGKEFCLFFQRTLAILSYTLGCSQASVTPFPRDTPSSGLKRPCKQVVPVLYPEKKITLIHTQ